MAERTIKQRLHILGLFVFTERYDKPQCKSGGWKWSPRWWRAAWKDTAELGN